jgi:ATP-dependent exoDNAse (exonuclease V) beta subunit
MPTNSKRPLKIFNASAGSGKTYNLVKEYILLLLSDEKDSNRFARIIAMTFTNKAAIEMKTRIIQALDLLSYPQLFGKKSDDYAIVLGSELGINPHEVHVRSKVVLQNILHRYEDFHVMTIDKFNLKLIRSFSRDLDLPNDFEVILNEKEVIEQVVDLLLDQLGKQGVVEVTKKVFEYAKNNLDEGEQWNFRSQLIDFGGILSKEKNQALIEKLLEVDFSVERYTELNHQLRIQREAFITRCQSVFSLFTNLGIEEAQLPGKSTTTKGIAKV